MQKMNILYAPWRSSYVTDTVRPREKQANDQCIFCMQFEDQSYDKKNFILKRYRRVAVMLNRYPYNDGHLLILPFNHVFQLHELDHETRHEMMELTSQSTKILQEVLECNGVNIGINLGKAAGAGLPQHLHTHVLPRWEGDTNWLPLLADTKQISVDLNHTYQELKPFFEKLEFSPE